MMIQDLASHTAAQLDAEVRLYRQIAGQIVALIDSDFITGETLRVDGGRHIR